ncbi:hypothetical protein [Neisseria sp. Ec49-e6-T10]|uniref:hypothetical protein n=1 Tax=Neisseria sp. Ec49-e6-T10 TaxID=3140744 RepID=UPI003EB6AB8E
MADYLNVLRLPQMLKKITILCLISLLNSNQLVIAQGLYSPRRPPPAWAKIDTSQIEKLVDQCFSVLNYKHRIPRIHPEPDTQEHWLKDRVVICSRYSMTPKVRKIYDESHITNSYFLEQNIQVTKEQEKQLNEIYKKMYLAIWKADLINVLYPSPPDDFRKEFNEQTGFADYINRLGHDNYNKLTIDELRQGFFGSKNKFEKIRNEFYENKYKEYKLEK